MQIELAFHQQFDTDGAIRPLSYEFEFNRQPMANTRFALEDRSISLPTQSSNTVFQHSFPGDSIMGTILRFSALFVLATLGHAAEKLEQEYNVLFIISDDLTATALSCYGNKVCSTPNIDAIAAKGTRYTRASVSYTHLTLPTILLV